MGRINMPMVFALGTCLMTAGHPSFAEARARNRWPLDPAVNVPICTESGIEELESMCADARGGSYILWASSRKTGCFWSSSKSEKNR